MRIKHTVARLKLKLNLNKKVRLSISSTYKFVVDFFYIHLLDLSEKSTTFPSKKQQPIPQPTLVKQAGTERKFPKQNRLSNARSLQRSKCNSRSKTRTMLISSWCREVINKAIKSHVIQNINKKLKNYINTNRLKMIK